MELINKNLNNIEKIGEVGNQAMESISNNLDNIYDEIIKSILPDSIENKFIEIKNSLGLNVLCQKVANNVCKKISNKTLDDIRNENRNNDSELNNINIKKEVSKIFDCIEPLINNTNKKSYNLDNNKKNVEKKLNNKINKTIENYVKASEKNKEFIKKWKEYYNDKDYINLKKAFNKIENNKEKILPIEETIKELHEIENLEKIIEMKGGDFNITKEELELARNLV